jgi:uncharacterized protein (DUF2249 family)
MNLVPSNAEQIEVNGATVPFHKYEDNGVTFLQFDSSKSGHPEPMINAMSGLQALAQGEKLVMINSKPPAGLFPKIEADFNFEVEHLEDGRAKIIFARRGEDDAATDFADTSCGGGSCQN